MIAKSAERQSADDSTIVIVANRGPHDFVWEKGHWIAKPATGGLVSMIEPLARQPNVAWFCCVSEPPGSEAERDALFVTAKDQTDADLNVVPVPLPAGLYHDYYGEISNEVLWMLQHHLVGQFGYSSLDRKRHEAWEGYMQANRKMAEAIAATEIPIRAFLIQDYHLYPLPALLRERFPDTPSLHFVHIPFPDPALLKLIPKHWRDSILRGLLGADVVAFQTQGDVRSFLSCCEELLHATVDYYRKVVIMPSRTVRVKAYPASVDPEEVLRVQALPQVEAARERLKQEEKEYNIVRVDRLDPSKNQVLGFTAFGRLLETRPNLRGRIRFLAFLVPSRTDLTIYRAYRDAVFGEVERINTRFAPECGFEPIQIFYTNDRAQAFAAMESCDVLIVNSQEDGMNLVVKEWAILSKKPGALIVSETTGVATEMSSDALLICPLDVEGTTQALEEAITMPLAERQSRLDRLRAVVNRWTARDWLQSQLDELGIKLPERKARTVAPPMTEAIPLKGGAVERELVVVNQGGLHARPAAAFVRCAREFTCTIEIVKEGQTFSAQSIFGILTANLNKGAAFTLRATGPDAAKAVNCLAEMVANFRD